MPSECIIHLEDELNVVDVYINLEHGCRGWGGEGGEDVRAGRKRLPVTYRLCMF